MSADSPSAADRIARFAELVDAVDVEGVTVVDHNTTRLVESGDLQGTIDLRIGDVPEETTEPTHEADGEEWEIDGAELLSIGLTRESLEEAADEIDDALENGEGVDDFEDVVDDYDIDDREEHNLAAGMISEGDDDEQEPDEVGHEDDDIQVVDSLQEAMENSDEPDPDTPAGRVLDTLREEGELAGPELKTLAEVGNVYTAISKLDDDGLIEKRDDPDDGRRTLYRPADWLVDDEDDGPVWNGEDPETIVADSSLPARVVLDDILDAAESASTVIEMAESLDVNVDNLEPVAWKLTLKKPDTLELVSGVDDRVETIREVVA